MDHEDFQSILSGLNDVKNYMKGERDGFAVHQAVDVRAIRKAARKTQKQFADTYHLPIGTVRMWEQNRRQPDLAAQALLTLIEREPETIERIMSQAPA